MLKTRKSLTVTGHSVVTVDNVDVMVASMTATISNEGSNNITSTILNKELYQAHKDECRADIDAFTEVVRSVEDDKGSEE